MIIIVAILFIILLLICSSRSDKTENFYIGTRYANSDDQCDLICDTTYGCNTHVYDSTTNYCHLHSDILTSIPSHWLSTWPDFYVSPFSDRWYNEKRRFGNWSNGSWRESRYRYFPG